MTSHRHRTIIGMLSSFSFKQGCKPSAYIYTHYFNLLLEIKVVLLFKVQSNVVWSTVGVAVVSNDDIRPSWMYETIRIKTAQPKHWSQENVVPSPFSSLIFYQCPLTFLVIKLLLWASSIPGNYETVLSLFISDSFFYLKDSLCFYFIFYHSIWFFTLMKSEQLIPVMSLNFFGFYFDLV